MLIDRLKMCARGKVMWDATVFKVLAEILSFPQAMSVLSLLMNARISDTLTGSRKIQCGIISALGLKVLQLCVAIILLAKSAPIEQ